MNEALKVLTAFADEHGIDLSCASLDFHAGATMVTDQWDPETSTYNKIRVPNEKPRVGITLNFAKELPSNLRALK